MAFEGATGEVADSAFTGRHLSASWSAVFDGGDDTKLPAPFAS